jgi:ribosome-binding factor A
MDTTRQQKFARLIQKELGDLFLKEGAGFYGKAFVTITTIKTSPDLGVVKVYLSVMGVPERQPVIDVINEKGREVRMRLGQRIKNQIRHIPELHFFLDDSFDEVEKIDKLFKKINTPPTEGQEGI